MSRVRLFGCDFDVLTTAQAVERVAGYVAGDALRQGVGVNVDQLVKADADPAFAASIAACDLVTADGAPVVWASRLLGRPLPERVAAIDLFDALLPRCAAGGWPIFLLGARRDVIDDAAEALERKVPGLVIAGHADGWFDEADEPAIAGAIAASGARLLFIGISSPKKERFVDRNRDRLGGVRFVLGVGGTFDIAAGRARRAPPWVARIGLEWVFRLAQEPRRLARRYLVDDVAFLRLLARELSSHHSATS